MATSNYVLPPPEPLETALRKLGENCNFQAITPDEILRDHLVFGISDSKV